MLILLLNFGVEMPAPNRPPLSPFLEDKDKLPGAEFIPYLPLESESSGSFAPSHLKIFLLSSV